MRDATQFLLVLAVLGGSGASFAAEVFVARDGMLNIDGQRTFVIGLYENPDDDAILDEVAGAGFNLVRVSADQAALDRLHTRKLYGWINTGGRIALEDNSEAAGAALRELVAAWAGHPALLVWEVPDEILWNCMLRALRGPGTLLEKAVQFDQNAVALGQRVIAGYTLLRQLDPQHPVWMNHAAGNSIAHLTLFGRGADIVGCDIYPVMPYPTAPLDVSRSGLAAVGVCTTRMQASAPDKPVWMVLQGMSWGDFNGIFTLQDRPGQYPSFEESRFMAYEAVARGARGVLYWGTHYAAKDGACWKNLLALARELADNQPLLRAPDAPLKPTVETLIFGGLPFPVKDTPIGVRALGKHVDGQTWWIVVNEFFFPVAYVLGGLDTLEGTVYSESNSGQNATVADGVLKGDLPRYGVHILRPEPEGKKS